MSSFFPHDHIRPGQKEFVEDLEQAFSRQQILIAQAPTGLGKTASVLSVALSMAIANKKKVFFLTNRHTQHKIAIDTIRKIKQKTGQNIFSVDLIGKRWMCNQEIASVFGSDFNEFCKSIVEKGECEFYNKFRTSKGLTVEGKVLIKDLESSEPLHNEELVAIGKDKRMCSYEIALILAKKAQVLIGDYYYLFNPFIMSTLLNKLELSLGDLIVIVDEGHNLPTRVTEMMEVSLTSKMLLNATIEAKKFSFEGVISWLQQLSHILTNLARFENLDREILITKQQFTLAINQFVNYEELINQLESAAEEVRKKQLRSYIGGIASFLIAWNGEEEGFARILSEQKSKQGSYLMLSYLCLDPAVITSSIFSQIYTGVIMSGTLSPTFMYKDLLGITNAVEKTYHSPFPSENRLTIIVPETSTKYNLRTETMYQQVADKCTNFVALIPGNVAIFFPSYDLRDKISRFLASNKKLFWEKPDMSKDEKETLLRQFKQEKDRGGILLGVTGANFAEGIDLPGDLLNGVVIVGLPLAKPNLKIRQTINYYQRKFGRGWDYSYIYPAMSKCIQSAGRCIRSEIDRGAVIFLDERFAWKGYYDCLPREGLIVSKDYVKLLRDFFEKKG